MNTINSTPGTTPVTETPAGEVVMDVSDPGAVDALKALLELRQELGAGGDGTTDDGGSGQQAPDWSLLEGFAPPSVVPVPTAGLPAQDLDLLKEAARSSPFSFPQQGASQGAMPVGPVVSDPAFVSLLRAEVAAPGTQSPLAPPATVEQTLSPSEAATLGSSILDSFFSQSSRAVTESAPGVPVPAASTLEQVNKVEELMNTMLDRVLVSDPLAGQGKEVRIKFQDNILPGTEARVWREEGRIMVEFVSTKAESIKWLEGSVYALSQRLDERLQTAAPSLVTVNSSGDAPADGRSRERDSLWDQARQQQQQQDEESPA